MNMILAHPLVLHDSKGMGTKYRAQSSHPGDIKIRWIFYLYSIKLKELNKTFINVGPSIDGKDLMPHSFYIKLSYRGAYASIKTAHVIFVKIKANAIVTQDR